MSVASSVPNRLDAIESVSVASCTDVLSKANKTGHIKAMPSISSLPLDVYENFFKKTLIYNLNKRNSERCPDI